MLDKPKRPRPKARPSVGARGLTAQSQISRHGAPIVQIVAPWNIAARAESFRYLKT